MSKGGNCQPLTWSDQDCAASTLQQYCKCHEIFPRKSHDVFKLPNHWTTSHPHMYPYIHICTYTHTYIIIYIYYIYIYIYIYIFIDAHLFLQVTTKEWRAPQEAKHDRPRATLQLPSQAVPEQLCQDSHKMPVMSAASNNHNNLTKKSSRSVAQPGEPGVFVGHPKCFGINWTPITQVLPPYPVGWMKPEALTKIARPCTVPHSTGQLFGPKVFGAPKIYGALKHQKEHIGLVWSWFGWVGWFGFGWFGWFGWVFF